MPAGDLVTVDYHLELRGLLMGPSTDYHTDPTGWAGLGLPAFKTQDVDLDQADGSFLGRDYLASRILTFPLEWTGTPAEVMLDLAELTEAWSPSAVDVPLYLRLPGWGKFHVNGRPRGLTENLANMPHGKGAALATFLAGDPAITFD